MSAWLRLAEGDDQTWTDLINKLGPMVNDALGRLTRNKEDIADTTSNVLLADGGIKEDELLARLLALNLERVKGQPEAQPSLISSEDDGEAD